MDDLPRSTRSVTDIGEGRIYLPPASIPGGHGLRSMALQAMAHRVLGHEEPASYADFLRQRLEINYFAAACLMPLMQSVEFLSEAKSRRDLAVEDFRDAFGVTHEAAALRLTNISTTHLDLRVHFLRVGGDGAVYKAYENDGLPLPVDVTGAVEGQPVCREWAARGAFDRTNRTTEFHQYTDTPAGTFWCSTQTGSTAEGSTPSPSACRSRTRSGSADARRRPGASPAARTSRAAAAPIPRTPAAGATGRGRAPGCTRTSSLRCRAAHSPGWTTASSTRSSTGTRGRDARTRGG